MNWINMYKEYVNIGKLIEKIKIREDINICVIIYYYVIVLFL